MAKSGKKLIIAVVVLVLAIAMATTATFAWFTMNQSVAVGQIDVDVTTRTGGLYFSDGATAMAAPATTDIKLDAATGEESGFKLVTEAGADADAKSYLTFTVGFKATQAGSVSFTGTVAPKETSAPAGMIPVKYWGTEEEPAFSAKYGKAYGAGKTLDTRAAYAARVAFTADSATKIWDPNKDSVASFSKGNLAQDYKNALLGSSTAVTASTASLSSGEKVVTLTEANGFFVGSITITIWLEGKDGDCFNSILSDAISVNLGFTANWAA